MVRFHQISFMDFFGISVFIRNRTFTMPSHHILASLHHLDPYGLMERDESRHHSHDKGRRHHGPEYILD